MLCKHHHPPISEHFLTPTETLSTLSSYSSLLSSPAPSNFRFTSCLYALAQSRQHIKVELYIYLIVSGVFSISITFSRLNHVIACIRFTLSQVHPYYSIIHSSLVQHLGCLHLLTIVNSAAVNIGYKHLSP